ncbi:MAG: hypothetical protein JAY99_17075 [Candidatus Thiodiazotropha lotti]|nr:hypothetical protein [Candidatus Thiodiazotropha endoloripes]MCG7897124.1 hypothetical protein [Candidatus Thiodiazotropha weberae]MCG7993611.1 hypothetical protein [Candidatus Thiodiazotropha lotti]MCG8001235.1 hypothetical protein [Candidatus Thiodiazotropha lotti]MCW4185275.1 hypothetical protein [Candidatus Thiodiazotropha weberae]MCW4193009.1 hypothetical protein [Candidatus Thiodiazotropha weberae]
MLINTPPLPRPLSRKGRGELLSPFMWQADDCVLFPTIIIAFGMMKNDLIAPFSTAYFVLLTPFMLIQIKTVAVYLKLSCQLLRYGLYRV